MSDTKELMIYLNQTDEITEELEKACERTSEYIAADNLATQVSMFANTKDMCLS